MLVDTNVNRKSLIDQIISAALPQCKEGEEVSVTVKAFMKADLPNELIDLLDVVMMQKSEFSNNTYLQNLLIITAIKVNSPKVHEYITRLDNFDGSEVAKYAI